MSDILIPMTARAGEDKRESVVGRVHMTRSTIYALIKDGDFPAPIKVGASSLWPLSEIDDWIERKKRERMREVA